MEYYNLTQSFMKSFRVAALWLLLLAPLLAQAQFTYTISNNSATITGYSGPGGDVVIPATLGGVPVVGIGPQAFLLDTAVTSIEIPATVTNIATGAFAYCVSLTAINVNVTNTIYSSAAGVLYDASQDTLIQYPGGLTGDFTIPGSVTNIASEAFFSDLLSGVTIPTSVTTIGNAAFLSCGNLTEFTVIPGNLFYSSVDGVLFNFDQTTLVQYPAQLTGTTYAIPGTVLNIGSYAFGESFNLTSISIPASVNSLGILPFFYCLSLQAINVDPANLVYSSSNGVLFNQLQSTLVSFPAGISGSYVVPNGISTIGAQAFAYSSLSSVTLPASVTSIQDYGFAYSKKLATATFLGNPPTFDATAFVGDNLLQFLYLPSATGWTTPLQGVPALLWNAVIQSGASSPVIVNNNLAFTITGTSNINVSVQSTTNLATGPWLPVQTLALTNGSAIFSVPVNTNIPASFFQLSTP